LQHVRIDPAATHVAYPIGERSVIGSVQSDAEDRRHFPEFHLIQVARREAKTRARVVDRNEFAADSGKDRLPVRLLPFR